MSRNETEWPPMRVSFGEIPQAVDFKPLPDGSIALLDSEGYAVLIASPEVMKMLLTERGNK